MRLKTKGITTEVIAVSSGVLQCLDTRRAALLIGVDRVILVGTDTWVDTI